ncbi:MAG: Ig-like domain-containing protein [Gallionellaceae bacterium]|jgi:hypothetical protein
MKTRNKNFEVKAKKLLNTPPDAAQAQTDSALLTETLKEERVQNNDAIIHANEEFSNETPLNSLIALSDLDTQNDAPPANAGTVPSVTSTSTDSLAFQQAAPVVETVESGWFGWGWALSGLTLAGVGVGVALAAKKKDSAAVVPANEVTLSGTAMDGYLKGAKVYLDINDNNKLDVQDKYLGITQDGGKFDFKVSPSDIKHAILVTGGIDESTQLAFNSVLKAPEGSTVITPLTTLVHDIASKDASSDSRPIKVSKAKNKVNAAFEISGTIDITTVDPIAAANNGDTNALKLQAAAIQVASLVTNGVAAASGATTGTVSGTFKEDAAQAVFDSLANKINTVASDAAANSSSAVVDMTDNTTVQNVIQNAKTNITGIDNNKFDTNAQNASGAIAAANKTIQSIANTANSNLANIEVVQKVAQGELTTQIQASSADTIAPDAPALTLATGANQATAIEVQAGAVTVSAEKASTITVTFVNGNNTLTKALLATGAAQNVHLTQTEIENLGDGTVSVTATAKDLAGNSSAVATSTSFVLDTVAPTITDVSVSAGLINAVDTLATTAFTGTTSGVENGQVINLSVAGIATTATVTNNAFAGTLDLSNAVEGSLPIMANVADVAGNTGSHIGSIVKDTVAPNIPGLAVIANADNATAAEAQAGAVSVTAEAGSSVTVVFSNGSNNVTKTVTGNGASPVAVTLTVTDLTSLGEGTISVNATATDVAGNIGAAATATSFVLDTIAPSAPVFAIIANADKATATEAQAGAISVTAEAGMSVNVVFSNGANSVTKTVTGNGASPVPVALSANDLTTLGDGTISVNSTTTSTDQAGNASTTATTINFLLDTIAPTSVITAAVGSDLWISAAESSANTALTLTGLAQGEALQTISIDGKDTNNTAKNVQATQDANGNWTFDATGFADGALTVNISVMDAAGNSVLQTLNLTKDAQAPVTPAVQLLTDSATAGDSITKVGNISSPATEAGALIEYSTDGGNVWTTSFTALEGPNSLQVRQTDTAGNISVISSLSFTLDTLVKPPVVGLKNDTGLSASDNVTSDGALAIVQEPGATLQYTVNGGSAWTDTFVPQAGLNVVQVRQTDVAGNISAVSSSFGFVLVNPPAAPAVVLSQDTGSSSTDGITSNGFLTATGLETGAVAEYSIDSGTNWSPVFTPQQGSNTVLVRQKSYSGEVSPSTNVIFTFDTVVIAPTVALTTDRGSSASDNISNVGTLAVTGTETGALVEYSTNGGSSWSQNFTAQQGVNNVLVRQTDVAGNVSASTPLVFTHDTVANAPGVSLSSDTGSSNTDRISSTGTLNAQGETGASFEYSVDNAQTWATSFTAVEGVNMVQVRQTDIAGNQSTATTLTFTLDTAAPTAPTVALLNDNGTNTTDGITTDGRLAPMIEAGARVEYSSDGTTNWSSTFNPVAGQSNAIYVRQIDAAGNASPASLAFTFNLQSTTAAPAVALANDSGNSATDRLTNSATLSVKPFHTGAALEYSADGGKTWSSTFPTLTDGLQTLEVRESNAGSGFPSLSAPITFTLDKAAPTAPTVTLLNDNGNNTTNLATTDGRLNVTGIEAGASLEYSVNNGTTWSATFNPVVGNNDVQVRQVDGAGNFSPATSLTFILVQAPAAPTVTLTSDTGTSNTDKISAIGTLKVVSLANHSVEYSVDAGQTWTTTFSALPGNNSVLVKQIDNATGYTSTATPVTFTFDTSAKAPSVSLSSDNGTNSTDNISNNGAITAQGETGATFEYSVNNGQTWAPSFTALEGVNTVQVRQTDIAGNTSTATTLSFTLDTAAPVAPTVALLRDTGPNQTDLTTSDGTLNVTGIETGAGLQYSTDTLNWSNSFNPAIGNNTVYVRQMDVAGNVSAATPLTFTLVAAPAAPSVALTSDSGISTDNISATGTLNVVSLTNHSVEYSVNGGQTWGSTFSAVEGANSVLVRQVDATGYPSNAVAFNFTLDTAANAPVVGLGSDTGISATDRISKMSTLQVTAETGASIEYSTDGGSTWSSNFTAQTGANTVQIKQTDLAGNISPPTTFNFTFDDVAPSTLGVTLKNDTGLNTTDKITTDGTLTATGLETGASVEYSVNGGQTWSASLSATPGLNLVQVRQVDAAGNASPATQFSFALVAAPQAPAASLTNDTGVNNTDGVTSDAGLTLQSYGYTVEYSLDGGQTWSSSFNPQQGANIAHIRYTDINGNPSAVAQVNFTLDSVASGLPTVALTTDSASATDNISNIGTLNIGAEATSLVEYSTNFSSWSTSFTAQAGSNTVWVRQTDLAGNISQSQRFDFVLDTAAAAPTLELTVDNGTNTTDKVTTDGRLTVSGAENGALVEYSIDNGQNWSNSFTAVTGTNNVLIRQTDVAGNQSAAAQMFTFTVMAPPAAPTVALTADSGSSATDNLSNIGTLSVTGQVTGATVQYSVNGGTSWATSFTAVEGQNTVQVRQLDANGFPSAPTTFQFTLDTQAPTANSVRSGTDTIVTIDEVSTTTPLTIVLANANDSVSSVTLSGTDLNAQPLNNVAATLNVTTGKWTFDATLFADTAITATVATVDAAGNTNSQNNFNLTKTNFVAPSIALTSDTGASATDALTSNAAFTLGGVLTGATVQYSTNGGSTWSTVFTPTQGDNAVMVRQINAQGTISPTSTFNFKYDSQVASPVVVLQQDTGASATDHISQNGLISVSGESGATIEYSIDNGINWNPSFTTQSGANSIKVRQTDTAGNISASTLFNFTLDTIVPATPTISLMVDNGTNTTDKQTSAGELAIANREMGTTLEYSLDNGANWTTNYVPGIGQHTVIVRQTDAAGNVSLQSAPFTYTLVAAPAAPTVNLTNDTGTNTADSLTNDSALTVTPATGNTLQYSVNGSASSTTYVPVEGSNTVSVIQVDANGYESAPTTIQFVRDTTLPTATALNVGQDAIIKVNEISATTVLNITLQNTADTVTGITLSGGNISNVAAVKDSQGRWTFDATQFADGTITAVITSSDAAGNAGSSSLSLTKDSTPLPPVTLLVGTDAVANRNEVISGSSSKTPLSFTLGDSADAVTAVTVTGAGFQGQGNVTVSAAQNTSTGKWEFDSYAFRDGNLNVHVVTLNNKPSGVDLSLTLDRMGPNLNAGGLVGTDTLITGSEIAENTPLTLPTLANGESYYSVNLMGYSNTGVQISRGAIKDANGNYSFNANQFADGPIEVQLYANDANGNASYSTSILTKNALTTAGAVSVTARGDAAIALGEITNNGQLAKIVVLTTPGDTVQSVTVSGQDTSATLLTQTAMPNSVPGEFQIDVAAFADGDLTVTVVSTNNPSGKTTTLSLDRVAQVTSAKVGADTVIDSTEVGTATPITLTVAGANDAGLVGNIYGMSATSNNMIYGYATQDLQGNWTFDSSKFADGDLRVSVNANDPLGNQSSSTYFTLTKGTPSGTGTVTGSFAVSAGGNLFINNSEAGVNSTTAGPSFAQKAKLTVQTPSGDTVSSVTISGTGKNGSVSVSAKATTTAGQYDFATAEFLDGALTVTVNSANAITPFTQTLTLDRIAPVMGTLQVNTDNLIDATEATTTVLLNLVLPNGGDSVSYLSLNGAGTGQNAGSTINRTIQKDANGNWLFNATEFADGQITATVQLLDAAGNTSSQSVLLLKNTLASGQTSVDVGGDLVINASESSNAPGTLNTHLNVLSAVGDSITAVTVAGLDAQGVAKQTTATLNSQTGKYGFDAVGFADGTLMVTVKTSANPTGTPTQFTLDRLAPQITALQVGTDTIIDATETGTATPLIFTGLSSGDTISQVYVINSNYSYKYATKDATTGSWAFDSGFFGDGALTAYVSARDAFGNTSNPTFTLTKSTGGATSGGTTTPAVIPLSVNIGGDAFFSYAEATPGTSNSGKKVPLTLTVPNGDLVLGVTVTGNSLAGQLTVAAIKNTATNQYEFDSRLFLDGVITAKVTTVNQPTGQNFSLTLDRTPSALSSVLVGNDAVISAAEDATSASLLLHTMNPNDTIGSVTLSQGNNSVQVQPDWTNGQWLFDATQLTEGTIAGQATLQDAAGNTRYQTFTLQKNTLAAGQSAVNVGADSFINATEVGLSTWMEVVVPQGETISDVTVTGKDAQGKAVTKTANLNSTNHNYAFDSKEFSDGILDVIVKTNVNTSGSTNQLTLDRVGGVATSVTVGGDAIIDASESASGYALMDISTAIGAQISNIMVRGTYTSGGTYSTSASYDTYSKKWQFYSNYFADGSLSVEVTTQPDAAGNSGFSTFNLQKSGSGGNGTALVTVGGDSWITAKEVNSAWPTPAVTQIAGISINVPTGETVKSVLVVGKDAANNALSISAMLNSATGKYDFETMNFANGDLSVTVNTLNGTTPVAHTGTLTLDRGVGMKSALVGGDTIISSAEVSTATVIDLTAATVGDMAQTVQINGTNLTGNSMNANAKYNWETGKWQFDATQFADGVLTVTVGSADLAGNYQQNAYQPGASNTFKLVKNTLAEGTVLVKSGGDAYLNTTESGFNGGLYSATHLAKLNVQLPAGETIARVTVSGNAVGGGTLTEVAKLNSSTGQYEFNSRALVDGTLTVTVTNTANTSLTSSITLDRVAGYSGTLKVGIDTVIDATETSTATVLNFSSPLADTVSNFSVSGKNAQGATISKQVTQNAQNQWVFDATEFANTKLSISLQEIDAAGNSASRTYDLTKNSLTSGALVTVGGDTYIKANENSTGFEVVVPIGETITGVTVSNGTLTPVTATLNTSSGLWTYSNAGFTDGAVTVHVTTNTAGTDVVLTRDTLAPTITGVQVGTDGIIDATETSAATPLTFTGMVAGDIVGSIQIGGYTQSGSYTYDYGTKDANSNWTFNASQFRDGSLSATIYNITDLAGNSGGTKYLTLTKQTATGGGSSTSALPAGTLLVDVAGDALIGSAEISANKAGLNIQVGQGDSITGVTVSGIDKATSATIATPVTATLVNGKYSFVTSAFAEGDLTVSVVVKNGVSESTKTANVRLDTVVTAPTVSVGNDTIISSTETLAATPLVLSALATGEAVTAIALVGGGRSTNAVYDPITGQWSFDATQFKDGQISMTTSVIDAAGNSGSSVSTLTKNTSASGLLVVAGVGAKADSYITSGEQTNVTLLVVAPNGEVVTSVTVTDGVLITPLTATTLNATTGLYSLATSTLQEGEITVTVKTATGVFAANYTLTKDTLAPSIIAAQVGTDAVIQAGELSTATPISFTGLQAGEAFSQVSVSGKLANANYNSSVTAYKDALSGNWGFDATQFADGVLTVNTTVSDTAGNIAYPSFTLTKGSVATTTAVTVDVGGNVAINKVEVNATAIGVALNVTVPTGDTVTSVSVSGLDKVTGQTIATPIQATKNTNTGKWEFNPTALADGEITVSVVTTNNGTTTQAMLLDRVIGANTVQVGGDGIISANELSTTTALDIAMLGSNDVVQSISVGGVNVNGWSLNMAASYDWARGKWVFDATQFIDGKLTLTINSSDAAGNSNNNSQYFNLTKSASTLAAGTVAVDVGGDAIINSTETTSTTWISALGKYGVALNVLAPAGETISTVTVSQGTATVTATKNASTGKYEFVPSAAFADGAVTITVTTDVQTTGATATLNFERVANVKSVTVGQDAVITAAEVSSATHFKIAPLSVGDVATSVTVGGQAASYDPTTGDWLFDTSLLANGSIQVQAAMVDANGNSSSAYINSFNLLKTASVIDSTGAAITVNQDNTLYQDVSTTGFADTFTVQNNSNAVVFAGAGNDTVILQSTPATGSSGFLLLDGGAGTLDTLQLSSTYKDINLVSATNGVGHKIKGFEVIDLTTDTARNTVTLSAKDLFAMDSGLIDAITGAPTLVINGTTTDFVNMGVNTNQFALQGTANTFDATGASGTGYSKYTATYADTMNQNHLVEVLLQNGISVQ